VIAFSRAEKTVQGLTASGAGGFGSADQVPMPVE
jgi:hypothetical protein